MCGVPPFDQLQQVHIEGRQLHLTLVLFKSIIFQLSTCFDIEDYNWLSSVGGSGNADVW